MKLRSGREGSRMEDENRGEGRKGKRKRKAIIYLGDGDVRRRERRSIRYNLRTWCVFLFFCGFWCLFYFGIV